MRQEIPAFRCHYAANGFVYLDEVAEGLGPVTQIGSRVVARARATAEDADWIEQSVSRSGRSQPVRIGDLASGFDALDRAPGVRPGTVAPLPACDAAFVARLLQHTGVDLPSEVVTEPRRYEPADLVGWYRDIAGIDDPDRARALWRLGVGPESVATIEDEDPERPLPLSRAIYRFSCRGDPRCVRFQQRRRCRRGEPRAGDDDRSADRARHLGPVSREQPR